MRLSTWFNFLRLLENFKVIADFLSVPDSSDERVAHDQTNFILDDVASRIVDRNDGAGVRSCFLRSVELDPESELLQILVVSFAVDPEVEEARLDFVKEHAEESSCPNKNYGHF